MTDPITTLVMSLSAFVGSVGSFQRIQEFLEKDVLVDKRETPSRHSSPDDFIKSSTPNYSEKSSITTNEAADLTRSKTPRSHTPTASDVIVVQNSDFGWDPEKEPILKSITMFVPESKISIIVGPVGCGKSTLLKAILGEIPPMHGSVYMATDQVAFCDQTAWHVNETIRNSIIAASEFDEPWYSTVLQACALHEDLRQLPQGDQTMIGSKGVALSGGQAQRIVSRIITPRTSNCGTQTDKCKLGTGKGCICQEKACHSR